MEEGIFFFKFMMHSYVENESCLDVDSVSINISAKLTDKKGKSETL